jgi:hypothetical protein
MAGQLKIRLIGLRLWEQFQHVVAMPSKRSL